MPIDVRVLTDDEFEQFHRVENAGFGDPTSSPEALELDRAVLELDRTIAGFDGEHIVSTATAFSFDMTMPGGGIVPVAGVSAVTVLPTHRRQGLLREMMRHQLDDVAARGEPMAILNASEAGIYERFGYGLAQFFDSWQLDTRAVSFRSTDPAAFAEPVLRLIPKAEAATALPTIYDAWRRTRPGAVTQSPAWWTSVLGGRQIWRGGGDMFIVLAEPGAHRGGYAIYTIDRQGPTGQWSLEVRELIAADPEVEARLWRFLLEIDLVGTVTADARPVDDPLRWRLTDSRVLQTVGHRDYLFVRIVDVPAALMARRYAVADDLVLEVTDRFRPDSAGRYRLIGGLDNATCERVAADHDVDLTLDIADLGSLVLGGVRARELGQAGRITEHRPGAVERADAFFVWPVAPFCSTRF